ncbi:NADP-dependent oxidoreductase [Nocardia sp. CDC160]|uniref:NADP-dependent oxidoreductase n=1 Tax=Nocardia sp. CDC160 TaxID=3112166 RepID=UPI002DBD2A19|nr:NADP-dependent oxidoreductase [Nocardia sp. CDC160]MEC3914718.1 NADP-dependent oxidoreductase [Nocardia sp. CDC160]
MSENEVRVGRVVQLVRRPVGMPVVSDFRVVEERVRQAGPGEVVVRNLFMSLDPGMLMQIGDYPGIPLPPFVVGEAMHGRAVGEVVESADPELPVGTVVAHWLGWREFAVVAGEAVQVLDATVPPASYLGFGHVAYVGLTKAAELREGDTVFVSSAAGATGSMAGQIARLLGAKRVVGSVGSPEKAEYARETLGYDAVFDYHDGPIADRLREVAPEGIDVYFDNVGGDHLRAAIEVMNVGGRIALCGALSRQRAGGVPDAGPGDLLPVIGKRLTLRGFTVLDHLDSAPEFGRLQRKWLADKAIVQSETIVDGLDKAPRTLLDLVSGTYRGKVVVRV